MQVEDHCTDDEARWSHFLEQIWNDADEVITMRHVLPCQLPPSCAWHLHATIIIIMNWKIIQFNCWAVLENYPRGKTHEENSFVSLKKKNEPRGGGCLRLLLRDVTCKTPLPATALAAAAATPTTTHPAFVYTGDRLCFSLRQQQSLLPQSLVHFLWAQTDSQVARLSLHSTLNQILFRQLYGSLPGGCSMMWLAEWGG